MCRLPLLFALASLIGCAEERPIPAAQHQQSARTTGWAPHCGNAHIGMTMAEIEPNLGPPLRKLVEVMGNDGKPIVTYLYGYGNSVQYVDGKVYAVVCNPRFQD